MSSRSKEEKEISDEKKQIREFFLFTTDCNLQSHFTTKHTTREHTDSGGHYAIYWGGGQTDHGSLEQNSEEHYFRLCPKIPLFC